MSKTKERTILICRFCGREYLVIPARQTTSKFCSLRCLAKNKIGKLNGMFGRKRPELSIKMRGKGNPNYIDGRKSKANYCIDCNQKLSDYKASRCKSCAHKGELGNNWQGGISNLPYPFIFNDELKEEIRKRDNYTCPIMSYN